MKAHELCELNDELLADNLRDARHRLFQLRFQAASENLDSPSELKKLRREVARIKTIQHERRGLNLPALQKMDDQQLALALQDARQRLSESAKAHAPRRERRKLRKLIAKIKALQGAQDN